MRFRAWPGIAAVALTASLAGGAAADLITKNKPAPAWSGVTVAGKPISSVHYKGKVVLLNFFSYT